MSKGEIKRDKNLNDKGSNDRIKSQNIEMCKRHKIMITEESFDAQNQSAHSRVV